MDWVDREREIGKFKRLLGRAGPERLYVLRASGRKGKTCLIALLTKIASDSGFATARVDFRDSSFDPAGLAERILDSLERSAAPSPPPGASSVPAVDPRDDRQGESFGFGVHLERSLVVGDVAARDVVKEGGVVRYEIAISEEFARRERLRNATERLLDTLRTIAVIHPIALLFDTFEASGLAGEWLVSAILTRIRDAEIPNTIAFLAGRSVPDLSGWGPVVLLQDNLPPFSLRDTAELAAAMGLSLDAEKLAVYHNFLEGDPANLGWFFTVLRQG